LVLADVHSRKYLFKKLAEAVSASSVDYVVVAGDVTHFDKLSKAVEVLSALYDHLSRPILFVPGNCDDPHLLDFNSFHEREIINIHSRRHSLREGYVVYGVGGSTITPFSTLIEWSEDQFEEMIRRAGDIAGDKLIMVTHSPIYGVMDEVNGVHVGSRTLRRFLEERQPLLWITGHLHEYSGYVSVGRTIVLNPGPFMRGYYALVHLNGGRVEVSIKNLHTS